MIYHVIIINFHFFILFLVYSFFLLAGRYWSQQITGILLFPFVILINFFWLTVGHIHDCIFTFLSMSLSMSLKICFLVTCIVTMFVLTFEFLLHSINTTFNQMFFHLLKVIAFKWTQRTLLFPFWESFLSLPSI